MIRKPERQGNMSDRLFSGTTILGDLIRLAQRGFPNELCGFVLNHNEIVEIKNVAEDPTCAFVMDTEELDRITPRYGEITAIWHTHPKGTTWPSPGDMRAIQTPGCINPMWQYWIVTAIGVFNHITLPDNMVGEVQVDCGA